MRVSKRDMRVVWAVSVATSLSVAVTAVLNALFLKMPLMFETDQMVFMALILSIFPPAAVNYLDARWKMSVDRNIPEFLRELSEAGRTGITLTRALDLASKRRYGPLSSELERVVAKLSWGGSLEEALKDFADRVDTKLAKRASILLSEIHRSGGDVRDVLDMVSKHIGELQTIEEERRSQLRTYISIIYIAFFIFLFIDLLLLKTLFYRFESLKEMMSQAGGLFLGGGLELKGVQRLMFHMSLIEGLFGGLVAGKMGEGSIGAGLKHSLILMCAGFLAFYLFVWR
jgi:flagellar protein FlaJ